MLKFFFSKIGLFIHEILFSVLSQMHSPNHGSGKKEQMYYNIMHLRTVYKFDLSIYGRFRFAKMKVSMKRKMGN